MRYKQAPNVWKLENLFKHCKEVSAKLPDGRYVPARPLGFDGWRERLRAAWLVFTGKADALLWPGQ